LEVEKKKTLSLSPAVSNSAMEIGEQQPKCVKQQLILASFHGKPGDSKTNTT
jgi:hypothetical protein